METNNLNEEDEDVVIQGSALHEHLSKLGYTDFESVSMPKKTYFEKNRSLNIDIQSTIRKIYTKIFSLYSWITQEKSISEKQLNVILNSETLLDDHFSMINSSVIKCNKFKTITLQDLIVTGAVIISSTCTLLYKYKIIPTLFASSVICYAFYIKHMRFYANRDLKNVTSLQNELFTMCKTSFKILRRDYKIKLDSEACTPQSFHFLGERAQYLQPLIETLIRFMKDISYVHYQCSQSIEKILPADACNDELYIKFDYDSFRISGDINYPQLKKLYFAYLLVQSQMLYLLAIAYKSDTWICSYQRIPEAKLARMIRILIEKLAMYKIELSKVLNTYETCKMEPTRYEVQSINRVKWHDPTVQLDLASHKLQLSYNQVFTIFKDIDDLIAQETGIDNETVEMLMQNLDKAFKEINTAKILAEFVVLLMAKSRFKELRGDRSAISGATTDEKPDLPVIIDSDPEILDEVFEEYIKEEYSELSHDETADEYSLQQRKLDKLLMKSFMSELREALIDKQKSMSERESKALQRIYKNISNDSTMNNLGEDRSFIPAPPPMPPRSVSSTSANNAKSNSNYKQMASPERKINDSSTIEEEEVDDSSEKSDDADATKYKNPFSLPSTADNRDEERTALPQILLETRAMQFVAKLSPAFLQEETFVGSGENSEDEIAESTSDGDENFE